MGGNNEFFENFERNKYLKKLPSMQRVKTEEMHHTTEFLLVEVEKVTVKCI